MVLSDLIATTKPSPDAMSTQFCAELARENKKRKTVRRTDFDLINVTFIIY
jgi:hypothetical protein